MHLYIDEKKNDTFSWENFNLHALRTFLYSNTNTLNNIIYFLLITTIYVCKQQKNK